jgi:maltooligosyltrehalose trehalohydrolase
MKIGAYYRGNKQCEFTIWAPLVKNLSLKIITPHERVLPMKKNSKGYWHHEAEDVIPGTRYFYRIDNDRDRPDPASFFQPQGVHGPSEVVDHADFTWDDGRFKGVSLDDMIMYEMHVGTFTQGGTSDDVIERLKDLVELGVNALNIMPAAQFPGSRNWGYDGVSLFAVQNSYGGPDGLKRLVNACHNYNIAVILDVVYNHLGPEGNYLGEFCPYSTEKYHTPWGSAINFDDAHSDDMRNFFIENALYWLEIFHIDALRLDAVHAIYDLSAHHFLQELAEKVERLSGTSGRKRYLIPESNLNDVRLIKPRDLGGYGHDAQWADDFHHCLHTIVTGETNGFYCDYGTIEHMVKAIRNGFAYTGEYSGFRKRQYGSSTKDRPARQFVIFTQTHDQVGNRMLGDRLSTLVPFETLKLAAAAMFFSPFTPFLFMGEEYGEESPFLYFISHGDENLVQAVREGRKKEFKDFIHNEHELPDPQSEETFLTSKLKWEKKEQGKHKSLYEFYKNLIRMRKTIPALKMRDKDNLEVYGFEKEKVIFMRRWYHKSHVFITMNFNDKDMEIHLSPPDGVWKKVLDSSQIEWMGPGTELPQSLNEPQRAIIKAFSCALYDRENVT